MLLMDEINRGLKLRTKTIWSIMMKKEAKHLLEAPNVFIATAVVIKASKDVC